LNSTRGYPVLSAASPDETSAVDAPHLARVLPFVCAAVFLVFSCIFAPLAGIEGDEAAFGRPLVGCAIDSSYGIQLFHFHIPLVIIPYAGALKSLIYWPVFSLFPPAIWSIRLPMILAGAVTVWLFVRWTYNLTGLRAACIAGLLLATDPSFILTNTFDWGPVALQHLLLLAGCVLITSRRYPAGFFCFGLAFWDKAVFIWIFSGLVAATLITSPASIRKWMGSKRRVGLSVMAFGIGILPLVVYNLHAPLATSHANIHPSFEGIGIKLISFRQTMAGSALFGILVAPASRRWLPVETLFLPAFLIAIVGTPFLRRPKARGVAIFAILVCVTAFLVMASIRYTGAAHHVVLLYPFPQLLVGVVAAALRPPRLSTAIAVVLVVSNVMVLNHYRIQLHSNGPIGLFTDATSPLATYLEGAKAKTVRTLDLGIRDSLNLLTRGRFQAREEVISTLPNEAVVKLISEPDTVFVSRPANLEYFHDNTSALDAIAQKAGYTKFPLRTIADSHGRPQFNIFSFHKKPEP
jgi:hypothetical protein